MTTSRKRFALVMIAVGIAGLLASRHFDGPGKEFLRAHGANLTFSFAAVSLISLFRFPSARWDRPVVWASIALVGVSAQEAAQGIGLYPGVFDPLDLLWNTVGVAVGCGVWYGGRHFSAPLAGEEE